MLHIDDIKDKLMAADYQRQIIMPNLYAANKDLSYIEKSREANKLLKELVDRNPNANILAYYYRSQIVFYHLTSDYVEGLKVALKYADLIKNSHCGSFKRCYGFCGIIFIKHKSAII